MKLTNDELLKLSDPNTPQAIKDFICEQKMDKQEVAICRALGTSLVDFCIEQTVRP